MTENNKRKGAGNSTSRSGTCTAQHMLRCVTDIFGTWFRKEMFWDFSD